MVIELIPGHIKGSNDFRTLVHFNMLLSDNLPTLLILEIYKGLRVGWVQLSAGHFQNTSRSTNMRFSTILPSLLIVLFASSGVFGCRSTKDCPQYGKSWLLTRVYILTLRQRFADTKVSKIPKEGATRRMKPHPKQNSTGDPFATVDIHELYVPIHSTLGL